MQRTLGEGWHRVVRGRWMGEWAETRERRATKSGKG